MSLRSHPASYPILASRTKFQFPPFWLPSILPLFRIRLSSVSSRLISFLLFDLGSRLCSGGPYVRRSRRSPLHHAPARSRPFMPLLRRHVWRAGCAFCLRLDEGRTGTSLLRLCRGLPHQPLLPLRRDRWREILGHR